MKFVYAGREFPKATKMTFGETAYLERLTGQALDEWTASMHAATTLFLSARREGLRTGGEFLTWAQMQDLSVEDFEVIDDDEDEPAAGDADPPVMTGEPSPSDAPPGTDEAAGSSTTDDATTS